MTMQSRVLCTLALVVAALTPSFALADAKFIYLTRHAEKSAAGADPELTAEGKVRAQNIAATLKKAGITSVYSTSYVRTKSTAQPLATLLSLPVQIYDGSQIATFAQQLKALPGNTLVVGHSDTTPELIRQLGGDTVPAIDEAEFDRLYQIAIGQDGDVTTTLLTSMPSVTMAPCAPVTLSKTGLAAAKDAWIYFTIVVPECANTLNVAMTGGTGDGDLHVRFNAQPSATAYDCRPYKGGNAETCPTVTNPAAGTWHIGIRAYAAFGGITLNATAAP
jgi:phosphohistidine phosphatase SixA